VKRPQPSTVLAALAVAAGLGATWAAVRGVVAGAQSGLLAYARYVEFDANGAGAHFDTPADAAAAAALDAAAVSSRALLIYFGAAILGCAVLGAFLTYPGWRRWAWIGLVTFVPAQVAFGYAVACTLLGGDLWLFITIAAGVVIAASAVDLVRGRSSTAGRILSWSNLSLAVGAIGLRVITGLS
jgi:hypothetical protein